MGKHFDDDFKEKIVKEYKTGEYGGHAQLAKKYGINKNTVWHWIVKDEKQGNQINDIYKKRGRQKEEDIIEVGTIKLSNLTREVTIDNEVITLTHTQFELLKLFLTNLNIALSREIIINKIWGYDYEADDRTIDAHIKLLRSKLKTYRDNIKTIRKVGYKFEYKN